MVTSDPNTVLNTSHNKSRSLAAGCNVVKHLVITRGPVFFFLSISFFFFPLHSVSCPLSEQDLWPSTEHFQMTTISNLIFKGNSCSLVVNNLCTILQWKVIDLPWAASYLATNWKGSVSVPPHSACCHGTPLRVAEKGCLPCSFFFLFVKPS